MRSKHVDFIQAKRRKNMIGDNTTIEPHLNEKLMTKASPLFRCMAARLFLPNGQSICGRKNPLLKSNSRMNPIIISLALQEGN